MPGSGDAHESVRESVQEYYGRVLRTSDDLKTNACCTSTSMPRRIKQALGELHDEVVAKYYGCGLTIPLVLQGLRVLDLGCGAGRDCFLLSRLVGPTGSVVGVDMTREQIETAKSHIDYHTAKFGYANPNVEFRLGFIEDLAEAGIADNSIDVIVSNCVVNLSPDKPAVLREAFRVLKPGGEFYFSDVYADRRLPQSLASSKLLWGECLGGALYWNDFISAAKRAGFSDPRLVEDAPILPKTSEIAQLLEGYNFYSATWRLFKIDGLEPACEDYGQAVRYRGTVEDNRTHFKLDGHHDFVAGKVVPVCGNTFHMLRSTRFAPHFDFFDGDGTHYGIFPGCGLDIPFASARATGASSQGGKGCC